MTEREGHGDLAWERSLASGKILESLVRLSVGARKDESKKDHAGAMFDSGVGRLL